MQTCIWHLTPPQQPSQLLQTTPLFLGSLNQHKEKGALSGQVNRFTMIPRKAQQQKICGYVTLSFLSQLTSYQVLIATLQKCSNDLTHRDWGELSVAHGLLCTHNFYAWHKTVCQMMCQQ